MAQHPDTIYAVRMAAAGSFRFDNEVAAVFTDMISRSVPGYGLTLDMIGLIARHYGHLGQRSYDLGCSLGASTLAMRHNVGADHTIVAVDNSAAMVERCRSLVAKDRALATVTVVESDIMDTTIEDAAMVTLNFTLQFIAEAQRPTLLSRICSGLQPGGALVLSEKIAAPGKAEQQLMSNLHHDFKRTMGYSDLEIAAKRTAIENVLIPDTLDTHKERLHNAGFTQVYQWFQCFNFVSLLAIK